MIFKSERQIDLPTDISLWSWLFDSAHSCLAKPSVRPIQGFTDATTGEHISFHDLKAHTTHLSTALVTERGLAVGDVATVYSKNSIWYPVATLSAVRVGAIACGVSPEYNVEELAYALSVSKSKFVVSSIEGAENALLAAKKAGIPPERVLLIGNSSSGDQTSLQDLLRAGEARGPSRQVPSYQLPSDKTNADVCANLCFSSGTTGLPKAVMISHANIMAQCLQVQQITPSDHDKILAALPFYHITGIVHQLHLPVLLNANVYVLPHFTFEGMLKTVADNKIRELLIVPPILIRMVREPSTVDKFDLSHVRRFSSGAAPLSREILNLLENRFPGTGFKQGYGMTESCSAITSHPPSKYAYKYADRVGMLVGSTEAKIVNPETGKDCGVGEVGEIWARGPQMAMGYLSNPKATTETFDVDGFLHTGDIGRFDEEGLLAITDRMKEMIKVKGIGVAPAELEGLLLGHPAVSDVAVCGVPDDRAGERPKAFVVLKAPNDGPEETVRSLFEYVKAKRARYKWIKEIELAEEIPKSPAGKILRRKLLAVAGKTGHLTLRDEPVRARL